MNIHTYIHINVCVWPHYMDQLQCHDHEVYIHTYIHTYCMISP